MVQIDDRVGAYLYAQLAREVKNTREVPRPAHKQLVAPTVQELDWHTQVSNCCVPVERAKMSFTTKPYGVNASP